MQFPDPAGLKLKQNESGRFDWKLMTSLKDLPGVQDALEWDSFKRRGVRGGDGRGLDFFYVSFLVTSLIRALKIGIFKIQDY